MKNITIKIILLIFAGGLAFWFFSKDEAKEEIIISGHPAWPPIMYQQDEKIVGAGPEIVGKIFKDLGIEVVSNYEGSWDIVQEKTSQGLIDVIVAAYKTDEREAYMDFSIPYTVDPIVLVVKKEANFEYENWDDLLDKRGVVTIGDSYGQEFDNFLAENLTSEKVNSPEEAFSLLENEDVDYFVYALYSAHDYIFSNNLSDQMEIIPEHVSTENFYITISKESSFSNLMPQVNSLIEQYKNDGTINEIILNHKQSLWDNELK